MIHSSLQSVKHWDLLQNLGSSESKSAALNSILGSWIFLGKRKDEIFSHREKYFQKKIRSLELATDYFHLLLLQSINLSFNEEFNRCIETFYQTDKTNRKIKYVRCKLCVLLPNIVKLNSDNNEMTPLTLSAGCRYRQSYVSTHSQTKYHKVCKMAINVTSDTNGLIEFHICW